MTLRRLLLCTVFAAAAAVAHAGEAGRPLYADMKGEAELNPKGDPDGGGVARITVNRGNSQVCWEISVRDIAPATAAHIHAGNAWSQGEVVLGLTAPVSGASSGCATVSAELAKGLLQHPADYYVNVHNADFPSGAIRGQLSSRKPK